MPGDDEMEEVSDAGMQPLGDAGMEQPPVIEPARKRRRLELDHQLFQRDLDHNSRRPGLLDLPVLVLLASTAGS